ncbi:class I tRNA ligase family protein [Candidatus Parcubacteria bacterium]|nr:class I tRNA ligase family protein [Candidatus Parcubacteria bacterium]
MNDYDPKDMEPKWQKIWEETKPYEAKGSDKPKYYALVEFPYPSGEGLHTGHVRSYTAMDIVARKRRREGFDVLYPIGWDAFGLPAENYAIKTGIHPSITTQKNIETYRKQLKALGIWFDWSREVDTTDPKYYKWTQWIFLKFLEHGLAYKAKTVVNWCPKDKIVLANEEVVSGKCERCGTEVEKREKEQWMLAITKYAERLDKDLDDVDYSERIKLQQRNWIGRSEGALIKFGEIEIFTTRPDTIFGATFVAIAPSVAKRLTGKDFGIVSDTDRENKEKLGVDTGLRVRNPATGEDVPVWVVNYVSADYGTGAIMAVPAHDVRDFEFAEKYGLQKKYVVIPRIPDLTNPHVPGKEIVFRNGVMAIVRNPKDGKIINLKWKKQPWTTFVMGGIEEDESPEVAARREIHEETGYKNLKFVRILGGPVQSEFFAAHKDLNRVAHTWQILFDLENDEKDEIGEEEKEMHDIVWVDVEELKSVRLSHAEAELVIDRLVNGEKPYTGEGILINSEKFNCLESADAKKKITDAVEGKWVTKYKLRDWIFSRQRYWGEPIPVIHCEKCGYVPVPEADLPVLLPEVAAYQPGPDGESPLANISEWVNTTCPKCGGSAKRETDVMPNWAGSSWYFLRYADPHNNTEFASKEALKHWMPVDWYNGGMEHTTLHLLYSRFWNKFLFDIGLVPQSEPYTRRTSHGLILAEGGEKMSKSKGNVVNPDTIVNQFGADTLRVYEMFMGPFDQAIAWSEASLVGPRRFLEKVWRLKEKINNKEIENKNAEILMHETVKKVSDDIESLAFNTAVSALMIWTNSLEKREAVSEEEFETLLKLLSPFAPHMTEELWENLGQKGSIHEEAWPAFDKAKLSKKETVIVIQVNGKVRASLTTPSDTTEVKLKEMALQSPGIQKWLEGRQIVKFIVIPNRVVNILTT